MANVVKKHRISSALAQKMVHKAVAKAKKLVWAIGVSGGAAVQNDIDCATAALALVSDAMPSGLTKD